MDAQHGAGCPQHHTTPEMVRWIFGQLHDACVSLGITLVGGQYREVTWGLDRPVVVGVLIGKVTHDRLITTGGAQVGDSILVKGIPIEATAIIAREKAAELGCSRL